MDKDTYSLKINLPKRPMKDENIQLENYLVAYIDILGITNQIITDKDNHFLKMIFDFYNNELACINALKNGFNIEDFKFKIFSDNIVFALKLANNYSNIELQEKFNYLTTIVQSFQMSALGYCHVMRGGITKGFLYINNVFLYGKALLDAYQLESTNAIYPRIIMDKHLIDELDSTEMHLSLIAKKDIDNFYYIDYLSSYFSEMSLDTLSNIRKSIIYLYQQSEENKVRQKYSWLINYFNSKCINKFKEYFIDINNLPKYVLRSKNGK